MEFEDVLRNFGDLTTLDSSLHLANKMTDMIKEKDYPSHYYLRIIKYIMRSRTPRLYKNLAIETV